jgi:hypothetical protein
MARCTSRSAVATERLSLSAQGDIRYVLKTLYCDGTRYVVFEPMNFLSPSWCRKEDSNP